MRVDIDSIVLDRVFQPFVDRAADWMSCFGLARLSLIGAVLCQGLVVLAELDGATDGSSKAAAIAIALVALFGAQQAWTLIMRTERQARAGVLNTRRITLRWQRLAWIAVTSWSLATGILAGGTERWIVGVSFGWLGSMYFVSCTPRPPATRVESRNAFA